MIDDIMPWPHWPERLLQTKAPPPTPDEIPLANPESGYIRFVDTQRLLDIAKQYHVRIRALRRVGHLYLKDSIGDGSEGRAAGAGGTARLQAAFDMGPTRTLQQDVELGCCRLSILR